MNKSATNTSTLVAVDPSAYNNSTYCIRLIVQSRADPVRTTLIIEADPVWTTPIIYMYLK